MHYLAHTCSIASVLKVHGDWPNLITYLRSVEDGSLKPRDPALLGLFRYHFGNANHALLVMYDVGFSEADPSCLSYWPTEERRLAGEARRVYSKPGKLVRKLAFDGPGNAIEDYYLDQFVAAVRELQASREPLTYHETETDFGRVYQLEACRRGNFNTSGDQKSLADSCMRYGKWLVHPTQAFASGDFKLAYLMRNELLAARTLVSTITGKRAPIYCSDQAAYDHLNSLFPYRADVRSGFDDHELLVIPEHGGSPRCSGEARWGRAFVPYLDCGPRLADRVDMEEGVVRLRLNSAYEYPDDEDVFELCRHDGYLEMPV